MKQPSNLEGKSPVSLQAGDVDGLKVRLRGVHRFSVWSLLGYPRSKAAYYREQANGDHTFDNAAKRFRKS